MLSATFCVEQITSSGIALSALVFLSEFSSQVGIVLGMFVSLSKFPSRVGIVLSALVSLCEFLSRVGIALSALVSLSNFPSWVGIALSVLVSLSKLSKDVIWKIAMVKTCSHESWTYSSSLKEIQRLMRLGLWFYKNRFLGQIGNLTFPTQINQTPHNLTSTPRNRRRIIHTTLQLIQINQTIK